MARRNGVACALFFPIGAKAPAGRRRFDARGPRPIPEKEFPISTALSLLAVIALVLLNAFFVATEFALVSVRRTRMQHLAAEGDRRAQSVLSRLNSLDMYIAATQLGITIASLGLGWIGEPALSHLLRPVIEAMTFLPESNREALGQTIGFIIAFSVITTLHIVLGELAPKSLALQRPEQVALATSRPIHIFSVIFRPVINTLNNVGNWVVRAVGIEPAAGHALVQSAEELRLSLDASREAGLVEEAQQDLVDRAFLFGDLDARQVMIPRTSMSAIPATATIDEILAVATESGHSRLPVYEGDLDHIVGVINVKRLLPRLREERQAMAEGRPMPPFDLAEVKSDVLAVPEMAPASDLLERLRESNTPIAIVVDEFGGTAGLVTLVDLIESIVGDIEDELDPESDGDDEIAPDGSFSLDGLTTLLEAREFHDLDLEEDHDVETVGGYVFSKLGRPAEVGDEVVSAGGHLLRVEEIDGLRVARLRVFPDGESAGSAPVEAVA
jgi:CBS domain containing-hemolysin-like protein